MRLEGEWGKEARRKERKRNQGDRGNAESLEKEAEAQPDRQREYREFEARLAFLITV